MTFLLKILSFYAKYIFVYSNHVSMSRPFARIINFYSRFIGFSLTFILPAVIIVGLALSTFNPANFVGETFTNWVNLVWLGFVFNSFILAFNAILVTLSFDAEVNKLTKEGTPINSAAGFRNLERKYKASNFYLFIISFFSFDFVYCFKFFDYPFIKLIQIYFRL